MFFKIKVYCLCSLILIVYLFFLPIAALSQQKLIVGYCEWGNYGGADKPDHGYYVDLVASILRLSGYEVETQIHPWARTIRLARKHEVDILPGVWLEEDQLPFLHFFKEAVLNYDLISFFVTHNSPIENGLLQSMKGRTIGHYGSGFYGHKFFEEKSITRWTIKDVDQAIRMLFRGRIDAYLSDIQTTESVIKNEFPELMGKYKILKPPFITKLIVPAIDKGHPDRVEIERKFMKTFFDLKRNKPQFFTSLITKHDVSINTKPGIKSP